MKYLYKKNRYYVYKRRIPYTDAFYYFNTNMTNCKKASKLAIIFNELTSNIFEYIKSQGRLLLFDHTEIFNVLNKYKEQALKENEKLEELRHNHLSDLFKVEEEDPLLGKYRLSGGETEVIDKALTTFKHLAIGSYSQTRVALKKHGKDIIKRGPPELKTLYSKLRKNTKETDLLDFLSMLFKTEAEILKEDHRRAKLRFSSEDIPYSDELPCVDNKSYTEEQKHNYKSIDEIEEDFLYDYCNYTDEILNNSKTNAAKVRKISNLLTELIKDKNKVYTSKAITVEALKEVIRIIPKIPKKPSNQNTVYNFYNAYKNSQDLSKNELRGIKTIKTDLASVKRYFNFLTKRKYITSDENLELIDFLTTIRRELDSKVKNNQIRDKENVQPFKDEMIKKIFNKEHKPYRILFDKLTSDNLLEMNILIARFYIPLIMFFVGARVAELVQLKTSDCDFEEINNVEKLLIYIEANEQKGSKSATSKRIILVHDFLSNDLNLINFVKKAKRENREYLVNTTLRDEEKISKAFNRDKEVIVNKIQGHADKKAADGYLSLTEELNESINSFKKHQIVDWHDFINMTKRISES